MLNISDKAPLFSLPNQDNQTVSLNDFSGQWLVLYFYPKDDTPGCTKEACDFTDALDEFRGLNAEVIGVSADEIESHQKFIQKYRLGISLLSDIDKTAHKAYAAWGLKKNYGKEYEGTIRSTFIINPEGVIAAKWSNVRVRSKTKAGESKHADKVREKLAQLQAE
ncbi:MAG: peroxiredoxin [Anaerolineales bacterium]|nr:peroxiredoxin [Chloroflexota bacterium]MBL6982919.1 peroxiredoxin [Anaerolineales bacterium]